MTDKEFCKAVIKAGHCKDVNIILCDEYILDKYCGFTHKLSNVNNYRTTAAYL